MYFTERRIETAQIRDRDGVPERAARRGGALLSRRDGLLCAAARQPHEHGRPAVGPAGQAARRRHDHLVRHDPANRVPGHLADRVGVGQRRQGPAKVQAPLRHGGQRRFGSHH